MNRTAVNGNTEYRCNTDKGGRNMTYAEKALARIEGKDNGTIDSWGECVDGPDKSWPVVGFMGDRTMPDVWSEDGRFILYNNYPADLIPVPTKHEGWMIYRDGMPYTFSSREGAEEWKGKDERTNGRTVVAHVTWED
jgi:hypothetical protein